MKKYIIMSFVAALTFSFTSCKEDSGTVPGNDSKPLATIYTYTVESPYNPDNDVAVRMVGNNQVEDIYFLAESKTAYDANMEAKGESGYMDYVIANGTKGEAIQGAKEALGSVTVEKVFTNLVGETVIAAVAVSPSGKSLSTTSFIGIDWSDVVTGTYQFGNSNVQFLVGMASNTTTLQVCTTDETLYRFKDVFGEGKHLKINLLPDYQGEDEDGTYTFFRVKDQKLGAQYQGNEAYVRDIGYWQGSDKYVTDYGYESGMYEDYNCFLFLQCHIGSTSYGYKYDFFVPDAE